MYKNHPWQLLLLLAVGIFTGSFWVLFGFLSVIGTSAMWWYYPAAVAPGSAILFLVLMARRAPVPYGVGLILLGFLFLSISVWRSGSLRAGVPVGIPVLLLGLGFVLLRKTIQSV